MRHRCRLDGPDLIPRDVEVPGGLVQCVHLTTNEREAELENRSLMWT